LSPPHCKLCEVADFRDPELRSLIREIFTDELDHFGAEFPEGHEYRKHWEIAMTARALREGGSITPDAEVLGVGAGHEATIYWLSRHVRRVFATDLYLTEDHWSEVDSGADMLIDPGRHWAGEWNPRRVVVQHMDALELRYEDESFDGVFSSGSIEHFGGHDEVRRSARQMNRVLRPGGVAALSTEFLLEGPGPGVPGILMFSREELLELLFESVGWEPMSELDTSISEETTSTVTDLASAVAERAAGRRDWSVYPHIVLRHEGRLFTSVHLAFRKPG
jgi:SAM-dependent methyltransferase